MPPNREKTMTRYQLTDRWTLTWRGSDIPATFRGVSEIPASVPGSPQYDIVRAGYGEDPLVGDNAIAYRWCERATFVYRREIEIAERGGIHELVFYGIDGFATVYVDGQELLRTKNAHHEHRVALPGSLAVGTHELRVEVESGSAWAQQQDATRYGETSYPERMFVRKPQYVFGWDWAPRLVSVGLWRPVEYLRWEHARLGRPLVRTSIPEQDRGEIDLTVPVVPACGWWTDSVDGKLACETALFDPDGRTVATDLGTVVPSSEGHGAVRMTLAVNEPRRWFPRGTGEQPRYKLQITLLCSGAVLDRRTVGVGMRTIDLEQKRDRWGQTFRFLVNGVPVFARGANWVPMHHLPGEINDDHYQRVLEEAAEANYNMLRVWGGGIYENDRFYEECDRLGILVWQDFLFACAEYPDDQPWFTSLVETEAQSALRRIGHHPSLALLCGNNENHWMYGYYGRGNGGTAARFYGTNIYEEILPRVCRDLCPDVPYWPSSPYGGEFPNSDECGDKHAWEVSIQHPDVWTRADVTRARGELARFVSEYGVLSLAAPRTVCDFVDAGSIDEVDFGDERCRSHDNTFNRGNADGRDLTEINVELVFGSVPHHYEEYAIRSMYVQAIGYREAIAAHRRRLRGCAGSLFWMHRDVWGTHGWTVVDFYDRRKPSYYWVRRAFAPVAVFVVVTDKRAESWVVNDTTIDRTFTLTIETGNGDERKHQRSDVEIVVPAGTTREGPVLYDVFGWVSGSLSEGDRVVAQDVTLSHYPKLFSLPNPELSTRWRAGEEGSGLLEITARRFALFVAIEHDDGTVPEDNYFNLAPGATRLVQISGVQRDTPRVTVLNSGDG